MRFNRGFIYFLLSVSSLIPSSKAAKKSVDGTVKNIVTDKSKQIEILLQNPVLIYNIPEFMKHFEALENQILLEEKATNLCDTYISKMLQAQQKLQPLLGTSGYPAAVRNELPDAPVYSHCIYGQYTHLTSAIRENGDTLTIIPSHAKSACKDFKAEMKKQYQMPEYHDCLHEGKMFASDTLYKTALNKYLARNNITSQTPDSVKMATIEKFKANNFSIDDVAPGSILVVPRHHGSTDLLHAIMYLGRGYVQNGMFIKDASGTPIYAGHNREIVGDLFKSYDSSNVFAVDTKKIVRIKYAQELQRIEKMSRDSLIQFLESRYQDIELLSVQRLTRDELLKMARAVYFRKAFEKSFVMQDFIVAQNAKKHISASRMQHAI